MGAYGQGGRASSGRPLTRRASFFLKALAVVLAAAVIVVLATLPPRTRQAAGADPALAGRTVGGAFHVHTTRSDGAGDKSAVARAARVAGLQFVIVTDHGDGTRPTDPPEYIDGVLCLDAVEISTNGGHYIALGASPAPYPLGGESTAVVEDVARLGGFGIAAHPTSRRPELAWADWSAPFDGLEWLNADSEWRDETRWTLARAAAAYAVRPSAALATLLDRPSSALARWDSAAQARPVIGIAGHDAHGGIGRRLEDAADRRRIGVPSYAASFGVFSTRVELDRPFTGDADADGRSLLRALKAGTFFTQIDAVATGATLEFTGRTPDDTVKQGSVLRGGGTALFSARAVVPDGAEIVAFENGAEIARAPGGSVAFNSSRTGVYRIEIHVDGAPGTPPIPWLTSNPIFRLQEIPAASLPGPSVLVDLSNPSWRIEKDPASAAVVRPLPGGEVEFQYRLRGDARASQFVALVTDLSPNPPDFGAVTFTGRSLSPQRVAVQLRFAADRDARWIKSVYLDTAPRTVTVRVPDLRRADGPEQRPDIRRATSLLFVVDLTNAQPGDGGVFTIRDLALAK